MPTEKELKFFRRASLIWEIAIAAGFLMIVIGIIIGIRSWLNL